MTKKTLGVLLLVVAVIAMLALSYALYELAEAEEGIASWGKLIMAVAEIVVVGLGASEAKKWREALLPDSKTLPSKPALASIIGFCLVGSGVIHFCLVDCYVTCWEKAKITWTTPLSHKRHAVACPVAPDSVRVGGWVPQPLRLSLTEIGPDGAEGEKVECLVPRAASEATCGRKPVRIAVTAYEEVVTKVVKTVADSMKVPVYIQAVPYAQTGPQICRDASGYDLVMVDDPWRLQCAPSLTPLDPKLLDDAAQRQGVDVSHLWQRELLPRSRDELGTTKFLPFIDNAMVTWVAPGLEELLSPAAISSGASDVDLFTQRAPPASAKPGLRSGPASQSRSVAARFDSPSNRLELFFVALAASGCDFPVSPDTGALHLSKQGVVDAIELIRHLVGVRDAHCSGAVNPYATDSRWCTAEDVVRLVGSGRAYAAVGWINWGAKYLRDLFPSLVARPFARRTLLGAWYLGLPKRPSSETSELAQNLAVALSTDPTVATSLANSRVVPASQAGTPAFGVARAIVDRALEHAVPRPETSRWGIVERTLDEFLMKAVTTASWPDNGLLASVANAIPLDQGTCR